MKTNEHCSVKSDIISRLLKIHRAPKNKETKEKKQKKTVPVGKRNHQCSLFTLFGVVVFLHLLT